MSHSASGALRPVPADAHLDAYQTTGTSPSRRHPGNRDSGRVLRGIAPLPSRFPLRYGNVIRNGGVAFEACGDPQAPTVVVLGGISAGRHVTSSTLRPSPGWWEPFVGPGRAVDTRNVRAVGIDFLGAPGASGGTLGTTRDSSSTALIDTADQAAALRTVLTHLGTQRVHAIVGSSYGGMVGLAFAAQFPESIDRLVCISAAHRSHPMATAHRTLQRRIVALGQRAGLESEALALARGLAMTTYRTAVEFDRRFDSAGTTSNGTPRFPVEGYLEAQGVRFAESFDVATFTAVSTSLDLHFVEPSSITTPTTVVTVDTDTLVPPWLAEELADGLAGPTELVRVPSVFGHDAFLKETHAISEVVKEVLESAGSGS